MKVSRLDLDGAGSPAALVTRILEIERDLPIPVPIEELAERFDIVSIAELVTEGFAAALVADVNKAKGGILLASSLSPERRRYSIGHELGHFLVPTHTVPPEGQFLCSREDMLNFDAREQGRRQRMEYEANRFAALMLMPPPILRSELQCKGPSLGEVLRLAREFAVSREAMARSYVEYNRNDIVIIRVHRGKFIGSNWTREFPKLESSIGDLIPADSVWHDMTQVPGALSAMVECDPGVWFAHHICRSIEALTEQVLVQANGYSMILLHAELRDQEEDEDYGSGRWDRR